MRGAPTTPGRQLFMLHTRLHSSEWNALTRVEREAYERAARKLAIYLATQAGPQLAAA